MLDHFCIQANRR